MGTSSSLAGRTAVYPQHTFLALSITLAGRGTFGRPIAMIFDPRECIRAERARARSAASAFLHACRGRDGDALLEAADSLNRSGGDGWLYAFRGIARMQAIRPEIKRAFLPIWVESKMLPLRVGNRPVLARALHSLLPRNYRGTSPLRLFRGATPMERRRRLYGFSWTTDRIEARRFAQKTPLDGGVVLETFAKPDAILLVRRREYYYDESEVVVDPFRLDRITVLERIPPEALKFDR